jgi:hypothetical protein
MLTPLPTQSSDTLYDQGTSELTSFEALMFDAMENIHRPVSGCYMWYRPGVNTRHVPAYHRIDKCSIHGMTLCCDLVLILTE